jgi:hypothetical protein
MDGYKGVDFQAKGRIIIITEFIFSGHRGDNYYGVYFFRL